MKLKDYLIELASDPETQKTFKKNPEEDMTKKGLTSDQAAAVLSKDQLKIQNALSQEMGTSDSTYGLPIVIPITIIL
ncbi:hypothetical protein [Pseudomonas chlororaphis]|uniref:hypothetical protein n=1 Tax=Pseudomonas chlororaphis TaxID=587753 RepID=UPI00131A520A|nr:hypothetical protein [Pseudomonas chlororaphis]